MNAKNGPIFSGSTRGLPSGKDFEYFCNSVSDVYLGVFPDKPIDAYPADFSLYQFGDVQAGFISSPGGGVSRDKVSLRTHPDDSVYLNFSRGPWSLEHLNGSWNIPSGVPCLLDNSETYRLTFNPRQRLNLHSIRIPRKLLSEKSSCDVRSLNDKIWSTESGLQLTSQTRLLVAMIDANEPEIASTMAEALIGLVNKLAEPITPPDRLGEFKGFAISQIHNPNFDIRSLAKEFNCSVRTIQNSFSERGETFSDWFASKRMDIAVERLLKRTSKGVSISKIATYAGYADLTTFYRNFKIRYDTTPSQFRNTGSRKKQDFLET